MIYLVHDNGTKVWMHETTYPIYPTFLAHKLHKKIERNNMHPVYIGADGVKEWMRKPGVEHRYQMAL